MVQLTLISKYNELKAGDQIVVKSLFSNLHETLQVLYPIFSEKKYYFHHGIYIGDEDVVHFSGETKHNARPCITCLRAFDKGVDGELYRVDHDKTLDPDQTIMEAKRVVKAFESGDQNSRQRYNVIFNNCETMATWLKTGVRKSEQVEDAFLRFLTVTVPLATLATAGVVLSPKIVRGLSLNRKKQ